MVKQKQPKPSWSTKRKHAGASCRRNQPIFHTEKKRRINLMMTPTANQALIALAIKTGESRSEVIEQALRSASVQFAILQAIKANQGDYSGPNQAAI